MVNVLQVSGLGYDTPDRRPLIRNLSFTLGMGELMVITGPNGIGKSTLLRLLLGSGDQRQGGTISWGIPKQSIGFLAQLHNREFHISLTLGDVLAFAGEYRRDSIASSSHGLLQPALLERAWNTASGGERQKVLLTKVFLREPQLLILDEPMNHLDVDSRAQLRAALKHFIADHKHAVLMVGHEASLDPSEWQPQHVIDLKGYTVS